MANLIFYFWVYFSNFYLFYTGVPIGQRDRCGRPRRWVGSRRCGRRIPAHVEILKIRLPVRVARVTPLGGDRA